VQLRVIQYDPRTGRAIGQSQPMIVNGPLGQNQRGQIAMNGVRIKTQQELQLYKVVVEAAELAR
jgi:hypothetical protein